MFIIILQPEAQFGRQKSQWTHADLIVSQCCLLGTGGIHCAMDLAMHRNFYFKQNLKKFQFFFNLVSWWMKPVGSLEKKVGNTDKKNVKEGKNNKNRFHFRTFRKTM